MFLKVSVPGLRMSVPKRCNIGKFAEMVSQGTDWWQIISVLLKNYQSGTENWSQSWSLQIISVLLKIYQSGTENWNQSWSLWSIQKMKHIHVQYILKHSKIANTFTSSTPFSIQKSQTPPRQEPLSAFKNCKHLHVLCCFQHSKKCKHPGPRPVHVDELKKKTPPHV